MYIRKFFQHFLSGGPLARFGFFTAFNAQCFKQQNAQLFGGLDIELLYRCGMDCCLQLQNAFAETAG